MNNISGISILFSFFLLTGCGGISGGNSTPVNDSPGNTFTATANTSFCEELSPATGNIINVSPSEVGDLPSIVNSSPGGSTIMLADGTYNLNGDQLWFSKPDITLRSASSNPDNVILNGDYKTNEIITVAASNITIAEITIKQAYTHPIHVIAKNDSDITNTLIYRVKIQDPREQGIKINPTNGHYTDKGTIACSTIELTTAGRANVNPVISGCYTGGIDAHAAKDWTVRDNIIKGFWCQNGLSEHAIHFWNGSRGTVVERNVILDNSRGIGFGLLSSSGSARVYSDDTCDISNTTYIGHYDGIIRNNFIFASSQDLLNSSNGFDCGVCLASACKATTVHNTIISTGPGFASIDSRFKGSYNTSIINNLSNLSLLEREGASGNWSNNITDADMSSFSDGQNADLHLSTGASAAIDSGLQLSSGIADQDIDGDERDDSPDIGADEI
jgi:hypothetical protein